MDAASYRPPSFDLSGVVFEDKATGARVVVLCRSARRRHPVTGVTDRASFWWCRCICGKRFEVARCNLTGGHTRSCGCKKGALNAASRGKGPNVRRVFAARKAGQ